MSGCGDGCWGLQGEHGSHRWRFSCTSYPPAHRSAPIRGIASREPSEPLTVVVSRVHAPSAPDHAHAHAAVLFPSESHVRVVVLARVSPVLGPHAPDAHEFRALGALFLDARVLVVRALFVHVRAAAAHVHVLCRAAPCLVAHDHVAPARVVHVLGLRLLRQPLRVAVGLRLRQDHEQQAQGGAGDDVKAAGRRIHHEAKEDAGRELDGFQVRGWSCVRTVAAEHGQLVLAY